MPVITDLDIINAGCAQIGAEPLQDLDEETIGGQAAQLIYDNLLDFCLDLAPWSFCSFAVQLAKITDAVSSFGHKFVFQMPAGRSGPPAQLISDIGNPQSTVTLYALEGDRVHASCDPLYGVFKMRVDPANWPGTFRLAVCTAAAAKLAVAIAHDVKLEAAKTDEAFGTSSTFPRGGLMGVALQVDSRAKPVRNLPAGTNPLLSAHIGGSRW